MTAPANRWKLGLFVVSGCTAAVIGLTWVGMNELKRAFHTVDAYFDEALTGLEEGSPVKFRGVTIGVVEKIRVADDKKHLRVQASLYDDYLIELGLDVAALDDGGQLPENLRAQVVMSWVTSTSFIQVDFFPDPPSGPQRLPFPVQTNTIRTVPSTAKSLEAASREFLRELPEMAVAARELIDMLRNDLQAARVPELARQLQGVLQAAEREIETLRAEKTIATTTATIAAMRDTAASLQQLADGLKKQIDEAQLAATTASLRDAAGAIGGAGHGVSTELAHLHSALVAIERLAALLERDPAALLRGRGDPTTSPLLEAKR